MKFSNLPIDITEVDYSDLPKLHRLSVETFNDTFRNNQIYSFSDYTNKNYNYGQLTSEIINPQSFFYFIYYNHKLAGYLKLNISDAQSQNMGKDTLEIDRIYIRHGFQYIGLEKQLLDLAIKKAHHFNKKVLWSSVWEHDSSIIHFYNQYGFKTIETQPFTLAGQNENDLVMEVAI
ncbi:GNAT family N-acetyltransferase [Companilactobacillus huachuanensis]|uniref:GNAT family N-acetyltransferase n=1 Tax=Companilactobacillus huachuanensis TaxID=2559914 RepID=A0ABW1RGX0_9LACO|nr:GNAT family N-acetyltransferase [Companilactobacillus huachuanensis]